MPNKPNPYYGGNFRNPMIANLFRDLSGLIPDQSQVPRLQSQIMADQARAAASHSTADLNRAKTSGVLDKNAAMNTPPSMLAELFLSGGKVSDSMALDPDWRSTMEQNASSTAIPQDLLTPVGEYQPVFSGTSAQEKIAMAIQEALMRGVNLTDIAKFAGQGGYLNNVNAGNPDAGMGFIPLFGSNPTANTALSTGRQDEMSARDSREAISLEGVRQQGRERLAAMKFEIGPDGKVKAGARPPPTPNISGADVKRIGEAVDQQATALGFTLEPSARLAIVSEVTRRMQIPDSDTFKNPATSLDSVVQDLQDGLLMGLEINKQKAPWYSFADDKNIVKRTPGQSRQNLRKDPDSLGRAKQAISQGASRDAVIQRLIENGIDPAGL